MDEIGSTDASYAAARPPLPRHRLHPARPSRRSSSAPCPTRRTPTTLGLPAAVTTWGRDVKRGLVVVTGPTGSGKSTTCAAVIDGINSTRDCHILTIEDPIEFLHEDKRAIVCQREIGQDAPSYHVALRAAMRQDPDVIMVGEVRDEETAMTALRAAETGHLVRLHHAHHRRRGHDPAVRGLLRRAARAAGPPDAGRHARRRVLAAADPRPSRAGWR